MIDALVTLRTYIGSEARTRRFGCGRDRIADSLYDPVNAIPRAGIFTSGRFPDIVPVCPLFYATREKERVSSHAIQFRSRRGARTMSPVVINRRRGGLLFLRETQRGGRRERERDPSLARVAPPVVVPRKAIVPRSATTSGQIALDAKVLATALPFLPSAVGPIHFPPSIFSRADVH